MNGNNDTNSIKSRFRAADLIAVLPLILILGYVPLLVRMVGFDPHLDLVPWGYEGEYPDFFLIWKMRCMLAVSVCMAVILFFLMKRDERSRKTMPSLFLLLPLYGLFVILSAIISPYRALAFTGTIDMFRTVPMVISFLLMCFYSYYITTGQKRLVITAKGAFAGVLAVTLIGTLQTFGYNIFNSSFFRMLILPGSERGQAASMTVEDGVYATFFNPDYFAVYTGMLLPVAISLTLSITDRIWKAAAALICLLLVICLIGSSTASGYISIILTAVIGVLIIASGNKKNFFRAAAFIVLAAFAVLLAVISVPKLSEHIHTAFLGTDDYVYSMSDPVIQTLDDEILFTFPDGKTIHICYAADDRENDEISVTDDEGSSLSLVPYDDADEEDVSYLMLDEDGYELTAFSVMYDEDLPHLLSVLTTGKEYEFTNAKDDTYCYITPEMRQLIKITQPEKYDLFPDAFMSGRGWIWNYSLPMLKDNMLLGTGTNLFIFNFPHNYAHYADTDEFDAKPHSMYLQQWIENGFPALVLLCIFFICYITKTVKRLRKADLKDGCNMLSFGLLLGVIYYLISGLVNDAMICVSPFLWIYAGIGLGLDDTVT